MDNKDKELVKDFLLLIRSSVGSRGEDNLQEIVDNEREVEGFNFLANVFGVKPLQIESEI